MLSCAFKSELFFAISSFVIVLKFFRLIPNAPNTFSISICMHKTASPSESSNQFFLSVSFLKVSKDGNKVVSVVVVVVVLAVVAEEEEDGALRLRNNDEEVSGGGGGNDDDDDEDNNADEKNNDDDDNNEDNDDNDESSLSSCHLFHLSR